MNDIERAKKWQEDHKKPCPRCGRLIQHASQLCTICYKATLQRKDRSITMGQLRSKYGKTRANVHMRSYAQRWNPDLVNGSCKVCGYSKHVELHHIIPLSKIGDDVTLGEANSLDNLVALCPTHHWEADHNMHL